MHRKLFTIICITLFVSVVPFELLSIYVVFYYLLISLLTFFIYARDKAAACNNCWRIRESTLHCLAILGGWFGALLAQLLLKHKTAKQRFQVAFYFSIAINLVLLLSLLNSEMLINNIIKNQPVAAILHRLVKF